MRAGSGHIELIGPTWFLRIRVRKVDLETGEIITKPQRISLGSKSEIRSEASARKVADRWLAAQNPESLESGVRVTCVEYFEHFIAVHVALMRKSSRRRYRSTIRHHLVPEFADELLDAVDVARVQRYVSAIAHKHARSTIKTIVATLLQILVQARREKFSVHRFERNGIKIPRESEAREQRHISNDELEQLIASGPLKWRALWAVMGYAGLRCSEALGLTWQNIDLDAGVIHVRQGAVLGELQLPKTRTSRADVPILPELDAVLRAYRAVVGTPQGLLFANRKGGPLRADNVRLRKLRPMLKSLGLKHAGMHAFRHGLPGRLNGFGVSPGVVQKVMRHASLAQTETYLHVATDDVHAAIDAARGRQSRPAEARNP
jgi:integrase